MQPLTFTASATWILSWKKQHKIVTRKITKFFSNSDVRNIENVRNSAEEFKTIIRPKFTEYCLGSIMNTDQSGFQYELMTKRTLEVKGSKNIEGHIEQQHSISHSYTIQPMISANGDLVAPLFIVLQEANGQFGPRVIQTMFKHKEIYVVASKSGKVTKPIVEEWFLNVYFKNAGPKSCLLADALTTYNDRSEIDRKKPDNIEYEMHILPKGSTGVIQPLDVYFFRQYKAFTRRTSDHIDLNDFGIDLHLRDNILKLQTLVHNQFRSPRFKNFIQYAWYKCGYISEKIEHVSPNEYCFDFKNEYVNCHLCENEKYAFIRCSWCSQYFCGLHFFNFHYCELFVDNNENLENN